MRDDKQRIFQIYCGEGKGKTTAAVGQAVRAAGNGFGVAFVQFLKNAGSGESKVLAAISGIEYHTFGSGRFLRNGSNLEVDRRMALKGMDCIRRLVVSRGMDMLVIDEAGAAIELGLLNVADIMGVLDEGEGWLDVVVTGRRFPGCLMERADLVTRMECVRHPYNEGVGSRRGIEF